MRRILATCLGLILSAYPVRFGEFGAAAGAEANSTPAESTMYTMLLLRDAEVRADLKLSPQSAAKIDALLPTVDYPFFLLRDAAERDRAAGLPAIQSALAEGLYTALSPNQRTRLDQLVFQARGTGALTSPETAARLQLTAEQVRSIDKIRGEAKQAAAQDEKEHPHRSASEQARAQTARATKEYQEIVALLDDRQRATLTSLIGAGFDFSALKWIAATAPELRNVAAWINSDPIELRQLRGKVVIVHFWAFGCINCVHNLPCYQRWYDKFPADRVAIIGIHTPETERERNADNLRQAVAENGIKYPIAFDAAADNWKAWANNMWPSVYLVDRRGQVRSWWYGELNWQGTPGEEIVTRRIEALLAEKE